MSRFRFVGVVALAVVTAPARGAGQDSQFGMRGLGVPGRFESVRARATGGAFAAFDALSPLAAAAAAGLARLSAGTGVQASYRTADFGTVESRLKGTTFPGISLGGPVFGRFVLAAGYSTYLYRSFATVAEDTIDVLGTPQPVTDSLQSHGDVTDLRIAVARRLSRRLSVGTSLHVLAGSSRVAVTRIFADSTFVPYHDTAVVAYDGLGAGASALLDLGPALRLAAHARWDSRLRAEVSGREARRDDLPVSWGGGVLWRPGSEAVFAAAASWSAWQAGAGSFDTFAWSVGAELGPARRPLRLGVRRAELPFGPGPRAPTELVLAAGTGLMIAGGRGVIDLGIERFTRRGEGLEERGWTTLLGLTVRP